MYAAAKATEFEEQVLDFAVGTFCMFLYWFNVYQSSGGFKGNYKPISTIQYTASVLPLIS